MDPASNNITRVHVDPAGGWDVNVRAFGQCQPTDCDWGSVNAHYENGFGGERIKAQFNSGFSITKLELREGPGDHLTYEAHTKFTDGSGRPPYQVAGELRREDGGGGYGPPPPGPGGYGPPPGGYGPPPGSGGGYAPGGLANEDCLPEEWSHLAVAHVGGDWKIVNGSDWVLDFGGNEPAAQQALGIIQHYQFTSICYVRRPNAPMTYWKHNDHVPGGNLPGEDCIGLDPDHVAAIHAGGAWKVADGSNWLLDYGPDKHAAEQSVAVIQNYRLNRQCFVARPNPPMQYWLAQ